MSFAELTTILVNWECSLIKIPDESGRTPLHYLAVGCFGRSSHLLLDYLLVECVGILSHLMVRLLDYISVDNPIIAGPFFSITATKTLLAKDPSSGYCADLEGSLPIHIAALNGKVGVIHKLIQMSPGCELSCNTSGQTILHVAVRMGRRNVVRYICLNPNLSKMILNTKDKDGNTALHLAVQKGCSWTFGILVGRSDVYLSFRNKNGHTPLDLAVLGSTSRLKFWPVCSINPLLLSSHTLCTFKHYLIYSYYIIYFHTIYDIVDFLTYDHSFYFKKEKKVHFTLPNYFTRTLNPLNYFFYSYLSPPSPVPQLLKMVKFTPYNSISFICYALYKLFSQLNFIRAIDDTII